jgi:D-alanine-D-alanine ligase
VGRARVGVLLGGRSAERKISLATGQGVADALRSLAYDVTLYDTDRESLRALLEDLPDCVFIALHGRWGEDGSVQGLLDVAQIPYTGSGVLASALAMNKVHSKRLFDSQRIPTPRWCVANGPEDEDRARAAVGIPLVVKPAEEGSALGVSIVKRDEDLAGALDEAARFGGEILVEQYVEGVELTVAILGNAPREALPIIEIVPATDWYDYEAKYTPGRCEHVIPARIPAEKARQAEEFALRAHVSLGCRDFSRVDILSPPEGELAVLEVNTIPGLTPTSLFPDAARAAGISFEELCERLVRMALDRGPSGV